MGETKEEGENGEDVCGSAGREQDERNRNMIDEELTDSPESSFFLTMQEPGLVLTQLARVPADL